jgi:hypothetical protein
LDREAMPTYYPGDTVRLNLEARHRPNFRTVTARLAVTVRSVRRVPGPSIAN